MSFITIPRVALLVLLLAACNGEDSVEPDPKQACLDANQFQRDATALENAIRPATDADVDRLNEQAASLSREMANEISSGRAAETGINDDLTAALNEVNRIITDLSTPNLAQAKLDVERLRNAMVTLAMDCSRYLS